MGYMPSTGCTANLVSLDCLAQLIIMSSQYELYTYFRSSCSARVRIAALYKGIRLKYSFINLLKDEQNSDGYVHINTSHTVPTLVVTQDNGRRAIIQQSIAILEFFEESRPDLPSLMPTDCELRARVRELVHIVACEIQPLTNLKILNKIKSMGGDGQQWQKDHMSSGLDAVEQLMQRQPDSKFAVGDTLTMADVVLSPAVDGALRFGVDMSLFPKIQRVYASVQQLPAFQEGGWEAQPDNPHNAAA